MTVLLSSTDRKKINFLSLPYFVNDDKLVCTSFKKNVLEFEI